MCCRVLGRVGGFVDVLSHRLVFDSTRVNIKATAGIEEDSSGAEEDSIRAG